MFDYYTHVQSMKEEKLNDEIKRLHNQLFKLNPASPMYDQILNMLDMAQSAYNDLMYAQRYKDASDEAMEIGTVNSDVIEPDYSKDELLDAVVTAYIAQSPKKE